MRIWQGLFLGVLLVPLVLGLSGYADAASVSGKSSTILEWYDDADEDTATPVYQYLNLNVTDIADKGWNFRFYGRLAEDLSDEVDTDSELYYAYLEKRDLVNNLDFRLGRQFVASTAGASVVDGIYLNYRLNNYHFNLFGGGDTKFDDDYHSDDLVFGGEIAGRFFDRLDLAVSYFQEWDEGELGYELVGFDAELDLDMLSLYGETRYSLLTEEVTYLLAGAHIYTDSPWSLRLDYLYSLPVFTSTSIYSVFAVDEYEEFTAEAGYRINRGLRTFARVTREVYESVDDATVLEAGIEKIRTLKFSGYLTGTWRDDPDGQDMYGFKAYSAYLFTPKFEAGVGANVDVLERQIDFLADGSIDDDDTTSNRFWVDATAYLTPAINLRGKVEYLKSDIWDEYYRGRVRLNFLF